MSIETGVTRGADERVNYYMGLAARIALAVACVGCVMVAGWFVFEGVALGAENWLRNSALAFAPPALAMAVFTALQARWHAFAGGRG